MSILQSLEDEIDLQNGLINDLSSMVKIGLKKEAGNNEESNKHFILKHNKNTSSVDFISLEHTSKTTKCNSQ